MRNRMHTLRHHRPRALPGLVGAGLAALLTVGLVPAAGAAVPAGRGGWQPDAAVYGVSTPSTTQVRMDDGVLISVEVVYPTDPATGGRARGSFPVLLTQNPYGAGRSDPTAAGDYFVQRGYIYVASAVRGTGASGGQVNWFGPRQGRDGAELVELGGPLPARLRRRGRPRRLLVPRGEPVVHGRGRRRPLRTQGDHAVLHGLGLLRRPDRGRRDPHAVRRRDRAGRTARPAGQPGRRPAVRHDRAAGRRRAALL